MSAYALIALASFGVLFAILLYLLQSDSPRVGKLAERAKDRGSLVNITIFATISLLLTALFGFQEQRTSEQQAAIQERESAPLITVTRNDEGDDSGYLVTNQKGLASYVTLGIQERFSFTYGGEQYWVTYQFQGTPDSGTLSLGSGESIGFTLQDASFDSDSALAAMEFYLEEDHDIVAHVFRTRIVTVNCYDNDNEELTVNYLEDADGLTLTGMNEAGHYPENNIGTFYLGQTDEWDSVRSLLASLLADMATENG